MAAAALAATGLAAQPAPERPTLDAVRLTLDQLEAEGKREGLSDEALADLRDRVLPIRDDLRERLGTLEAELAEIEARRQKLGPPPAADTPPEEPGLAAERQKLNQSFAEADAAVKQARLLTARAEDLQNRVTERRRDLFTRQLFERGASILDPYFWMEVSDGLPRELRSLGILARSWWTYAENNGGFVGAIGALLTLLGLAVAMAAVVRWWRRTRPTASHANRFAKTLAAMRRFLRIAATTPLLVLGVLSVLNMYSLVPPLIMEIGRGVVIALAVAAFGRGIITALFAPGQPDRRLIDAGDETAERVSRHFLWATRALALAVLLNAIHKAVAAPLALTVATSGLMALGITLILLHGLVRIEGEPTAVADAPAFKLPGLRMVLWLAVLVAGVALLVGYIGFAAFITGRLVVALAVFGALYLSLALIDTFFTERINAASPRGRAVASTLGLQPRSLELAGTLASGVLRLLLIVVAVFLIVGPGGVFATDFVGALEGIAFGFTIGGFTISLSAIMVALLVLLAGFLVTRALQRWLELHLLPRTGLEPSLQISISTIIGYVGIIAVIAMAMSSLGIDLQKIAFVAGALSVGIGFGLQSIVSNFVSGLILLAERPIRVGDSIVVKGEEGYVRRISVRATEIETFERASVIVPNSELITGVVKNWTHANSTGRIIVKVAVAYDCDPDEVRDVLMACACEHPQVLQTPAPRVLLLNFGDTALEFELRCVVANVDYGLTVRSDLHFAILHRFRKAGIGIPHQVREGWPARVAAAKDA